MFENPILEFSRNKLPHFGHAKKHSPTTLTHFRMNDASLTLDFSQCPQEITFYLHTSWDIVFIEDSLIELFKTNESYETTTFGCKKNSQTHCYMLPRERCFLAEKCSTQTSASVRHHELLSIFSRSIEKTCRTSFAKQHSSAKTPFPQHFSCQILFPHHFSRHSVTDAFWMHGFSDPNDFRSKTTLLRHQNSKCYFQEPNWNRNLEPPRGFFQEPKPEPPEP